MNKTLTFNVGDLHVFTMRSPGVQVGSFEDHTYTGKILKSENWHGANTVAITSDHPNVRMRILQKKWITKVDDVPYSFESAPQPKSYTVAGSKGAVYNVVIDPSGNHTCDCSAFKFRPGPCKHIISLLDS